MATAMNQAPSGLVVFMTERAGFTIALYQQDLDRFSVQYGLQLDYDLGYQEAALKLGAALIHSLHKNALLEQSWYRQDLNRFFAQYGLQLDYDLNYQEAALKLGAALMHSLACEGKMMEDEISGFAEA